MTDAKLKIALVAKGFPPELGGSELYNVEYAKQLAQRGHDVRVITWETDRPGADEVDRGLPFEVRRFPSRLRGKLHDVTGIDDALADWGSEVTLISRASKTLMDVARVAAGRTPVMLVVHTLREKHRGRFSFNRRRIRDRYSFDVAKRIAVSSHDTWGRLQDLGVSEDKMVLLYPGVDTTRFCPDPDRGARIRRELGLEHRKVLLTVARLAHNKGHDRVIACLPEVLKEVPDCVYLVVGEGNCRGALERQRDDLGLHDAVVFTGEVDDVRDYYNACDVFIMASVSPHKRSIPGEGFGISYAEASACEKPVIGSSSGGGTEVVIDRETGLLVDPEDGAAMRDAITELLSDTETAQRLATNARARARSMDWSEGVVVLERELMRCRG